MVDFRAGQKGTGGLTFGGVVGQEDLKTGLLAVAADDGLDGILVRGEKGTAKSTTVRALADLLPHQRAVADCPYGCDPADAGRQCADCRDRVDPPVTERSVPLVTLPLGATRDRVVGTLSVADALDGAAEFDPGLLARANRGVLYVDEVNLLDDHLVDVLLDVAASGRNRVERDGVSVAHPAEFTLVGTMNPEEGDLRPQLRDRFAVQATVTACDDLDDRVAIVERALDDDGPTSEERAADERTRRRLVEARERLARGEVTLPREFARLAASICRDAGVDGHRGDVAVARTARALAALDGRSTVIESDVERAAGFALPHRLRSRPFEDAADLEDVLDEHLDRGDGSDGDENAEDAQAESGGDGADGERGTDGASADDSGQEDRGEEPDSDGDGAGGENQEDPGREAAEENHPRGEEAPDDGEQESNGPDRASVNGAGSGDSGSSHGDGRGDGNGTDGSEDAPGQGESDEQTRAEPSDRTPAIPGQASADVGEARGPNLDVDAPDAEGGDGGSRARGRSSTDGRGARVRTTAAGESDRVDAAASVRAAARNGSDGVRRRDLRASVRTTEASALVVFAVDASASMRPAMERAKGVVLELLRDAYEHRDEVAFVAFAGEDAEVLLPPTDSVALAARHLKELPAGDRTPLPAGLETAARVVERADPDASVAVVVTDGRGNVGDRPTRATRRSAERLGGVSDDVLVVDAGDAGRAGLVAVVAEATDGSVQSLSDLAADGVDDALGAARGAE